MRVHAAFVTACMLLVQHTPAAEDFLGNNPFFKAIFKNDLPLVEEMVAEGADVNGKARGTHGYDSDLPLNFAIQRLRPHIVLFLLDNGADVNGIDSLEMTPLDHSAHELQSWNRDPRYPPNTMYFLHLDLADVLVDRGAHWTNMKRGGLSALEDAARAGSERMTRLLLDLGVDASKSNALPIAAGRADRDVAILLLNAGASPTASALTRAALGGDVQILDAALNAGGKLEDVPKIVYDARSAGIVRYLLERGADPNVTRNPEYGMALHQAVSEDRHHIARALLEGGADVNSRTVEKSDHQRGLTPLHIAARRGNLTMVKLLISFGADIDARTEGRIAETAVQLAEKRYGHDRPGAQHDEVIAFLRQILLEGSAAFKLSAAELDDLIGPAPELPLPNKQNDFLPGAALAARLDEVKKEQEKRATYSIYFATPCAYVPEDAGRVKIPILISQVPQHGRAWVDVRITGGTADDDDYKFWGDWSGSVSFTRGYGPTPEVEFVEFFITDDRRVEPYETIEIELANTRGASLGLQNIFTLHIGDVGAPPLTTCPPLAEIDDFTPAPLKMKRALPPPGSLSDSPPRITFGYAQTVLRTVSPAPPGHQRFDERDTEYFKSLRKRLTDTAIAVEPTPPIAREWATLTTVVPAPLNVGAGISPVLLAVGGNELVAATLGGNWVWMPELHASPVSVRTAHPVGRFITPTGRQDRYRSGAGVVAFRSADGAKTWSGPEIMAWPSGQSALATNGVDFRFVTVENTEDPHLRFTEPSIFTSVSRDAGGTWSELETVHEFDGRHRAYSPDIAGDATGTWVVTWQQTNPESLGEASMTVEGPIVISRSTDNGSTWSQPRQLTEPLVGFANPKIAADGEGNWCVAFVWTSDRHGQGGDVHEVHSIDHALTWSAPTRILPHPKSVGTTTRVALHTDGHTWIMAWSAKYRSSDPSDDVPTGNFIWYTTASGAFDWHRPIPLSRYPKGITATYNGTNLRLIQDGTGNWFALWDARQRSSPSGLDEWFGAVGKTNQVL